MGGGATGWLVVALLVGLAVRTAALWFVGDTPLIGDQLEYHARAAALAEGHELLGEGKRPPGTIWFLAGFIRLTGADPRAANLLLSVLAVWLTWILGRRLGGPRVAVLSAFGAALYPVFALYGVSLWSEPLYMALTLGALVLVDPGERPPCLPELVGAGALSAAACLTREVGLVMPAVCCLWLLVRGGIRSLAAWRRAAIVGLTFAVLLTPWTVRQSRVDGTFVLVSRTNGLNLFLGNAMPEDGRGEVGRRGGNARMYAAYQALGRTPAEREAAAAEIAWRDIRNRMPWWPLEKVVEMVPDLLTCAPLPAGRLLERPWSPPSAARWAYVTPVDRTSSEWLRDALAWTIVATWMFVLLAGTAGLALARATPVGLFLLFISSHVLSVVVTYAGSRYRLPIVPLLVIGAGAVLVHGREWWAAAGTGRRLAAAAAVLLAGAAAASEWRTLVDPAWS